MTEVPATDPSQTTPVAEITLGDADVIDFDRQPAPRKRRRTAIVSGVAAVLVAAGGVGAYAGVRAWTGSAIVEPEAAMPASTAAFLRVDLKPGYRDQLAFDGLAKKFPGRSSSTTDLITKAERQMLEGSMLSYDADVAPWFGQRAGIAAYADQPGHVVSLVALASNDDAKAKQALGKVSAAHPGSFGFVVRDGYALIAVGGANPQAIAATASDAAAKSSLADDPAFRGSVSHLPGNNLVVGYADLSKVGPLIGSAIAGALATGGAGLPDAGGLPGGAVLPGGLGLLSGLGAAGGGTAPTDALAKATGHIAIGASVVDDGVEVHMHTDGAAAQASGSVNAKATLDAMPDSAIVALATRGLDKNGAGAKQLNSMLENLTARAGGGSKDPAAQAMQAQLGGMLTGVLTSKVISLEFGGITNGTPNLIIAADTGDASAAASLAQGLGVLAGVPGMQIKQDGSTVRATVGAPQTGGKLADSALYREAMKGAGNSSVAAFIDVQKLVDAMGGASATRGGGEHATANLAPVKAIGVTATSSGTTQDLLIRVIIK